MFFSFININGSVCGPVTLDRRLSRVIILVHNVYIISIISILMRLHNSPLFQGITLPLDGIIKLTDDFNLCHSF